MNSKLFFFLFVYFLLNSVFAQQNENSQSITDGVMTVTYIPSIAQQIKEGTFIGVDKHAPVREANPKRMGANKTVPGKGLPKGKDPLISIQELVNKKQGKAPNLVFDAATTNWFPSDPTGAVGINYYIGAWNQGFRIFNKSNGTPATAEVALSTFFPGNQDGDPIVFYDAAASRFVITEMSSSYYNGNGFEVAVCAGSDPINDGWYKYFIPTPAFPDYPKFSVWSDGYYVTTNIQNTNKVFALERSKMLTGNTAQFVSLPLNGLVASNLSGGFYSPQIFNVSDANLPAPGNATVVYFQDDAWSGVSSDHLKLWSINIDWNNTGNSTISSPTQIGVSSFNSVFDGGGYSNLSQPAGPDIDALQATIMNQAQFRKFATHNSVVFNFVVDTNSTNEKAGIRWYELRQNADGQPWYVYQEGTYTSPNNHAFNASMAMDLFGNIGMGYTTVSTTNHVGIQYTGRMACDPLGTMTISEQLIAQSNTHNPKVRYADYSQLTIDPVSSKEFWYISEYFKLNGANTDRTDVVGVFQLEPYKPYDLGVIDVNMPIDGVLGVNETINITIKNFGDAPIPSNANFLVWYQIDGMAHINESCNIAVSPHSTIQYSFTTSADLSMSGHTYTILGGSAHPVDQDPSNNTAMKTVTNIVCTTASNTTNQNIGPNSGSQINSIINIPVNNVISDVNVTIDVTHCKDSDLDIYLTSPDGTQVELSTDNGATGQDYLNTTFDDQAIQLITTGTPPFNNSFKPEGNLSDFIGLSTQGNWTLSITDDTNDHAGKLKSWDLSICYGSIGVYDNVINSEDLIIASFDNNQYTISLNSKKIENPLYINVYDIMGKVLVRNKIDRINGTYSYKLDMSYAAPGVYLIKLGDEMSFGKVKRIIVK